MSEQTSTVAPPAAGAGVAAADELAAGLALTGALAEADCFAVDGVADSASAWVSVATAACVAVLDVAFDFVAGLHAAKDSARATTAAAIERARTCMAAPCSCTGRHRRTFRS